MEQPKTRTRKEKKKNGNGREEKISVAANILSLIREENSQNRKLGFGKSTVLRNIIAYLDENYDEGGNQLVKSVFSSASEVGQAFHRESDQQFYEDAVMISTMAFLLWDDKRDHIMLVESLKPALKKRLQDDGLLTIIERKLRARKKILCEKAESPSVVARL